MKKIILIFGLNFVFFFTSFSQQVLWDTIISFGALKDVPVKIISFNTDNFSIFGYTENSGNTTTDPFAVNFSLTSSMADTVFYHTPSNYEIINDAIYNPVGGGIELVGSDSISALDRSSFSILFDGASFTSPQMFDLSLGFTDEFVCITNSGSQAKISGNDVFGYAIDSASIYNGTTYINGAAALVLPTPYNSQFTACFTNNYMLSSYALGYNDSLINSNFFIYQEQYGVSTQMTYVMPGNQVLNTGISGEMYIMEFGAGYSDFYGTKDAFLVAFDPYSLDTLWTRTYVDPGADEEITCSIIKDTILFLFGNRTVLGETDIFVKQVSIYSGNIIYEYFIGKPGIVEKATSVTPNDICTYFLLTSEDNDIHIYKMPYVSYNVNITNVSCYNAADGAIVTQPSINGNYYFTYHDTASNFYANPVNLPAGTYIIDFFDTLNSCNIYQDTVIINQPDSLIITPNITGPTCQGLCDGSIDAVVTGGTPPYSFFWDNGASLQVITGLCTGNYAVTVNDANGCFQINNITLSAPPPVTLTGFLSLPSAGLVGVGDAVIYLYKDTSFTTSAYQISAFDSTVVMFNGEFTFSNLFNANYYLKAKINSQETIYDYAVTTYYDTVINWFDALPMTLQCGNDDTVYMELKEMPVLTGTGSLSGQVVMSGTKAFGEPVMGAEVFAEQEPDEQPIANTQTDTSGNYHMGGLPIGNSFKLTVDIPGLPLISTYAGIDITNQNDSITDLNFFVDTTSGGGIYIDSTVSISNINTVSYLSVYPNPFVDDVEIEINVVEPCIVSMEIIDITGKTIISKKYNLHKGRNIENIDTKNIIHEKGVYFLKILLDNNILIKKIIKQ